MPIPVERIVVHLHAIATTSEVGPAGERVTGGGAGLLEVVETSEGIRVSIACCGQKLEMAIAGSEIERQLTDLLDRKGRS